MKPLACLPWLAAAAAAQGRYPVDWRKLIRGETVQGVLYNETGGQGANPVRGVHLAVGDYVYYLEYAPRYFKPRFGTARCWEPGSIWTVTVTKLEDLGDLIDAACTGTTDKSVHEPFLLVRNYLNSLAKNPQTSMEAILSSGAKTSKATNQYETFANKLDLSFYSNTGRCLGISRRETPNNVQVRTTDCLIQLEGRPVNLEFSVVRDLPKEPWRISQVVLIP